MGYSIRTQDGIVLDNIPDNIAPDSIELKNRVAQVRAGNIQSKAPAVIASEMPKKYTASEAATQGAINLIPSTVKFGVDTASALLHPVDTVGAMLTAGAGGLSKILPESVNKFLNKADEAVLGKQLASERLAKETQAANAIGESYKDRYGSMEGFKRSVAEDPASILGDVSTLLTGGATLAPKAGKLASALRTASEVTNPLYVAEKIITTPTSALSSATKSTLGITTGAGKEAINQAVKAGETGNQAFIGNLRKLSNMEDVVDVAKSGLDTMRKEKNDAYRSGMYDISQDKSILNFDDIDNSLANAVGRTEFEGQVIKKGAAKKVDEANTLINKWRNLDPAKYHTPEGMDALKQQIGDILEEIPFEQKNARAAIGDVYNSIKQTIGNQAPTYAGVMKKYSEATETINEIKKALSLGEKAAADTSLKKLQSILRDDVSSSFGHRKQLAEQLVQNGAEDLMPALAGQSLSSFKPRGLTGQLETIGGLGYVLTHPAALGTALMAAPFAMPRVVGEAAYAYGKGKGAVKKASEKMPFTKEQARKAAMLLQQTQPNQEEQ